ncbi:MAG: sigma-70 family RNA polymerase sigma factor [Ignavibacteriaceae bacterium]|nr:sigma-70 family RNA polymerase sigma factor [Ignavibacteriaceae bacterium]
MVTEKEFTDSELLHKVAQRDSKALESLYNRYSALLFTLTKRMLADNQKAEETLANVFLIIWKKASFFKTGSNNAYSWILTLTRNKILDTLRREKNTISIPYDDSYEDKFIIPPSLSYDDKVSLNDIDKSKEKITAAMNKLTDAQRYVIELAYFEGLTENEIATQLNIPLLTVQLKLKTAIASLMDNFNKEGRE